MNVSAITQVLPPGGTTGVAASSNGADDFAAAVAREQADAGLERVDDAGGTGSGSWASTESPRETPGSSEGDSSAAAAAELGQPQTAPSLPDMRPMPDSGPVTEDISARPGEQSETTAPRSGRTLPGEPHRTDLTGASLIIDRGAHTLPAVRPEQSVIDNGAQTLPAIRPESVIDSGASTLPATRPDGSPAVPPVIGTLPEGEAWPAGVTAQAAPVSPAGQPASPQTSGSPVASPLAQASPQAAPPASASAQASTAPPASTAGPLPGAGDAVPAQAAAAQHPTADRNALRPTDRIVAEPTALPAPAVAPTAASAPVSVAAPAAPASAPASPPLLMQLSQPVVSLTRAGAGEHRLTITVSPDDLGPITVHARIGADGIRIELHAPSDAGRDALRGLLADLRRDLAAAAPQSSLHLGDGEAGQRSADQRSAGQHGSAPGPGDGSGSGSGERDAAGHGPGSAVSTPVVQAAAAAASAPTVRTPHSGIDVYA